MGGAQNFAQLPRAPGGADGCEVSRISATTLGSLRSTVASDLWRGRNQRRLQSSSLCWPRATCLTPSNLLRTPGCRFCTACGIIARICAAASPGFGSREKPARGAHPGPLVWPWTLPERSGGRQRVSTWHSLGGETRACSEIAVLGEWQHWVRECIRQSVWRPRSQLTRSFEWSGTWCGPSSDPSLARWRIARQVAGQRCLCGGSCVRPRCDVHLAPRRECKRKGCAILPVFAPRACEIPRCGWR